MSDLYPSGPGLPASTRPAQCTCISPAVWRHRPTGCLLCDDHAADIDLDDLDDLRGPDL